MISKNICIFVNVDWFVLSHFTDYLIKCRALNHSVTVVTLSTGRCDEIRDLGIKVLEVDLHRGYSSLFGELKSFLSIYSTIKKCSPDVLEVITIKPIVFGGLIAKILGIKKVVFYMSGLGTMFTHNDRLGGLKAKVMSMLYKFIMSSQAVEVIVENEDDKNLFMSIVDKDSGHIHLVSGVGVDLNKFTPSSTKSEKKLRVAIASRLLRDKGVYEFFIAAGICKRKSPHVEFLVVGDIDPTNPASLTKKDVAELDSEAIVDVQGHRADMEIFLQSIDVFVLPSYREGFPRAIMEAAATGLPVITTNVTGCRSAVIDGVTGIIVPPKDPESLARAIDTLIFSSSLRNELGKNARVHAEKRFDVDLLTSAHINVWSE